MSQPPTSEKIMQLGMAYWGSKTLLSAVELEVFTTLGKQPLDAETLQQRLDYTLEVHGIFLML